VSSKPFRDAACVVLVRGTGRDREVYWVRRGEAVPFQPGFMAFPGGKVEAGETPREALESLEESRDDKDWFDDMGNHVITAAKAAEIAGGDEFNILGLYVLSTFVDGPLVGIMVSQWQGPRGEFMYRAVYCTGYSHMLTAEEVERGFKIFSDASQHPQYGQEAHFHGMIQHAGVFRDLWLERAQEMVDAEGVFPPPAPVQKQQKKKRRRDRDDDDEEPSSSSSSAAKKQQKKKN